MSQGSSNLKPGTGSYIQSGQKSKDLIAGKVRTQKFWGKAWWEWDREENKNWVNTPWEDRKGKAIWGWEAKESQLMQLPFPGGKVSLKVTNDGPTLIGANASFSVVLHFPESQKVLPDGQVIWANSTIINGRSLLTLDPYS